MTKSLIRPIHWVAFAAALALLPAASPARRHLHLVKSAPAADTTLAASPAEITLWFSAEPTLKLTRISLLDGSGGKLPLGAVKAGTEPKAAVAALEAPLVPGAYSISWVTGSPDGHVVRGKIAFTVAPPAAPAPPASGSR
ncbi:MAG: copper resistance CopC family protein [Gemmatimonadales bacterium]